VSGDDSSVVDGGKDVTTDGPPADVSADVAQEAEAGTPGLFVNATSGNDANPGTLAKPFKTIKHAFSVAKSGDTVVLMPGTFGAASGDDFSTPVPDGVTVSAQGTGTDGGVDVTLAGGSNSFTFAGSGSLTNVALSGFTSAAIVATTGTQTVNNVSANNVLVAAVSGSAHFTYAGGVIVASTSAFTCQDTAVFVASNLTVTGGTSTAFAFSASCNATVSKSAITNASSGTAVSLTGTPTVMLDTVDINNGLAISESGGSLTLKNGTFSNQTSDSLSIGTATVDITGTSVQGCGGTGINSPFGTITATSMTISGCALDGIYSQGSVKLRSCTIKNNVANGVEGLGSIAWDFGTGGTPGNNTFQNNGATNVSIQFVTNQTPSAVGNTWNALVQGADNAGHYGSGAKSGFSQSGANFKTSSSAQLLLGP
jgi:hypothetical protein